MTSCVDLGINRPTLAPTHICATIMNAGTSTPNPSRHGTPTAQVAHAQPGGSQTQTATVEPAVPASAPQGVLRLRGAPARNAPRVTWTEDVVDNEGCGKKKSKSARATWFVRPSRLTRSPFFFGGDLDTSLLHLSQATTIR